MKKIAAILLIGLLIGGILLGFDNTDKLEVTNSETTVIKSERILRYDFTIENTGDTPIQSKFDYPGHHYFGIEVVVRPNEKLASLMEMVQDSKYDKMIFRGGGGGGSFEPSNKSKFHLEYEIKEGSDLDKVKKYAYDSTLLILDGPNVIAEIDLSKLED
ncbi:hypothetical protein J2S74_001283 [Evansella vedderi]|uniref:DUF4352 domain-containing protein n=1 Tax=Evansella vedderi TaxID=38282 RepID=A0ABT9ZRP7_9BACI|nr:hypothetical protein [Evansella vedderi]MDQ0253911.1 hypothetical protein [Evansella vedderi]